MEGQYASRLRKILESNYKPNEDIRTFFRRFWLLQHLRTEAASRRAVEMNSAVIDATGQDLPDHRLSIKEAVQTAMLIFAKEMHIVDDLKICFCKNRTKIPFITSDDPAVLTNRLHLTDRRMLDNSFGLSSAGNILLLPLTPQVLCLGYDGNVNSVPNSGGWIDIKSESDVKAFNEHQFLNCMANVFVHDKKYSEFVAESYDLVKSRRLNAKHELIYAELEDSNTSNKTFKVVDLKTASMEKEAMIHTKSLHHCPIYWPKQIRWRRKGFIFTNDTGLGFVRQKIAESREYEGFRKESTGKGD
jgi:hypothetical protein